MTDVQRTLYGFGLGYAATRLARHLCPRGWKTRGTVREEAKATALVSQSIKAVLWSGAPGEPLPTPPHGAHWLISIPPDEWGCPAFRAFAPSAATASTITYLSTSGVYGDLDGGWAFETAPVNPGSARAHARVLAEDQWRSVRADACIVRLPGIYGPGRSAFDRLRKGTARRIIKPGQVFSRVHVDDIASGLMAILAHPRPRGIYHLCDDEPAPPQDVIAHAATLLGHPTPPDLPIDQADLSPMARSFYSECKRLSNARTKAALHWTPTYPTYREGLAAILTEERDDPPE
ncbi:MAG: SDR family oxidoreductase [Pseudomonadota bacterium]